jgi:hypothetical protein
MNMWLLHGLVMQASLEITATQKADAERARQTAELARQAAERQVADYQRRLQVGTTGSSSSSAA